MIDTHNVITSVDEEFDPFAAANNAPHLDGDSVLGTALTDYITGTEMRRLHEIVFTRIRTSGRTLTVPFRCDSAVFRRFMEMDIIPDRQGGLEFITRLVSEQPRPAMMLFDTRQSRTETTIRVCGWCRKVELADNLWAEVEVAANQLKLFEPDHLPKIAHSLCDSCRNVTLGEL